MVAGGALEERLAEADLHQDQYDGAVVQPGKLDLNAGWNGV